VPLLDVDRHSTLCKPNSQTNKAPQNQTQSDHEEDSLIVCEREISAVNDKIDKLTHALRTRLIEIEIEDQEKYGNKLIQM
jgi:hypothetical protein